MLIAPVFERGATSRELYLPEGAWYDWWTGERVEGGRTVRRAVDLATMPIYARAGSIIPLDPVRQYTMEPTAGPTTLRVYPGADGRFTWYDDDGKTQEYLTGRGSWTRLTWDDRARRLTIEPGPPAGATNVPMRRALEVLLMSTGATRRVTYDGVRGAVAVF